TVGGTNPVDFKVQPPTITVTNPNSASHVWTVGTMPQIAWSDNLGSLESLKIELSLDGGSTYQVLFAVTPSDGKEKITVQGAWVTTQGRVRITWLEDGSVSDVSNANFPIE